MAAAHGQHLIFRQAVLAILPHAAANDGITPPRNRGLYPVAAQWHCPLHNGKVALVGRGSQQRCGKGVLGAEHKTAGVFVNAVDRAENAGAPLLLHMVQPAVGQRAIRVVQRGVYGDARRLVEHCGKFIFIGDGKRYRLRRHRCVMFRWQRKGNTLPGVHRLVGVQGGIIGKKAAAVVLDGLDQPCRDALHSQEQPQLAALVLRRHSISQNGHSAALLKAYMRLLYHKTRCDANPNVWQCAGRKTAAQQRKRLSCRKAVCVIFMIAAILPRVPARVSGIAR